MNNTTLNMTTLDGGNVIIKRGEGGGATINNQDKVVDITENGTTEVVADGGYTGLGKVTINTEVSGGESGGIKLMYLNLAPMGGVPMVGVKDALGEFNPIAKTTFNNIPVIIPLATTSLDDERMVDAVALFIGVRTLVGGGSDITTSEAILDSKIPGWSDLQITEEEFYSLD
jgi:hypothetical protein